MTATLDYQIDSETLEFHYALTCKDHHTKVRSICWTEYNFLTDVSDYIGSLAPYQHLSVI